jgi:hypothetical protein
MVGCSVNKNWIARGRKSSWANYISYLVTYLQWRKTSVMVIRVLTEIPTEQYRWTILLPVPFCSVFWSLNLPSPPSNICYEVLSVTIIFLTMGVHRLLVNSPKYSHTLGTVVAQWLMYYATNRKGAGSIPDCVTGIFYWHNPSVRTTALGSNQPLTEMSTRSISWG